MRKFVEIEVDLENVLLFFLDKVKVIQESNNRNCLICEKEGNIPIPIRYIQNVIYCCGFCCSFRCLNIFFEKINWEGVMLYMNSSNIVWFLLKEIL